MDFFDKLGKTASKTYKGAAEITGKLAKEAKLKMKMAENKAKIEDIYEEIGKKVYEKHIREENINIKDELKFKILILTQMILWLIYDLTIKAYTSAIFETITIISCIITAYQIYINRKKEKQQN